ncbi:methyltransferase, FkbM family [Rhizobiales bacterium GAS191]|jgi:FkbM family methyltransferase|nr:methyltransferase, FkbM family [Rhizobiales bacterium GAS113]SEC53517.1 methyltransferase, FkbM family [Rhizobiales bacterium GAS191]SEC73702.1 methyltransferase, FkbM family [Rhizobiales bacterium GAS188]
MSDTFAPYVARGRFFRDFVFDFHITNQVAKEWYDCSVEQRLPEFDWCADHVRPGFTVVDCGAHHGLMSLLFSRFVAPSGRVIAFEVLPSNAAVVEANAKLNGIGNVTVRAVGVGDKDGEFRFHGNSGNVMVVDAQADLGGERVRIRRLDDELRGIKVDFLKLDVEGFERQALSGASHILSTRPIIDLELHNFCFDDRRAHVDAVMAFIEPLRYRFQVMAEVLSQPTEPVTTLDKDWIASLENPHIMCLPLP